MRQVRILLAGACLLTVLLIAGGCSATRLGGTEKMGSDGRISVYYLEEDGLTLTFRIYSPVSESFDGILSELLKVFAVPEATGVKSALPGNVAINDCMMGVDNLTLDFNAGYLGLTNVEKALLQAAVVKTLVQLPGVMSISITVDGQQVRDEDGTALTFLNEDSFVLS